MATKEAQYAVGAEGYKAMVADFKEMFDWDAVEPDENGGTFTTFKKSCGDKTYVGLQVQQISSAAPNIRCISNNGTNSLIPNTNSRGLINMAYAYGNGFFVYCGNSYALPTTAENGLWGGISTCRNLLTGETSWCAFINGSTSGASYLEYIDYYLLSKDSKGCFITDWCLTQDAKVGAAAALHETHTGFVTDRIMLLTAIPDSYRACLCPVVFNGVRYNRLGSLLVPAE